MEHLAILKEPFLELILCKEKTIESRWYAHKKAPYERIAEGDVVYLKGTGKPVAAKAVAGKAMFFDNLNEEKIIKILRQYGKQICIDESYAGKFKGKNYCTVVFLKDVERIEPFNISKKGYGNMAAWISVDDIRRIKL